MIGVPGMAFHRLHTFKAVHPSLRKYNFIFRAMSHQVKLLSSNKSFEGQQCRYQHYSDVLKCDMNFSVYFPPTSVEGTTFEKSGFPWILWLSGLTCTDENFVLKAGAQQYASLHKIAIVCPDTSPRHTATKGEDDRQDLGTGAGFYVNAIQPPWDRNYKMDDYVNQEIHDVVSTAFSDRINVKRVSVMGHSMGGHGALTSFLRHPAKYLSVSAFAPLCNPTKSAWARNVLKAYLGSDEEQLRAYDTVELVKKLPQGVLVRALIDQGAEDEFLEKDILVDNLKETIATRNQVVGDADSPIDEEFRVRIHPGYDHSYFFIASFISDHLAYHASILRKAASTPNE